MNKKALVALAAAATTALVPLTILQMTSAGAASVKHHQLQPGNITIESWLYAVPSENVLSGTVWTVSRSPGLSPTRGVAQPGPTKTPTRHRTQ
jgi:hypothetical protein